MPVATLHLWKYRENKKFLDCFSSGKISNFDWAVTVVFYCALHLIEKFLSEKINFDSGNHDIRYKTICQTQQLKKIAPHYNALYMESIRARYYCENITEKDFEKAIVFLTEIEDYLKCA